MSAASDVANEVDTLLLEAHALLEALHDASDKTDEESWMFATAFEDMATKKIGEARGKMHGLFAEIRHQDDRIVAEREQAHTAPAIAAKVARRRRPSRSKTRS